MPEFKLTKELGTKKFELLMAVDYDEDGNIESQEFYDGVDWIDNPADIKFNSGLIILLILNSIVNIVIVMIRMIGLFL